MKFVETHHAPAAIGPYSQGIVSDGLLFASGQIPIDPGTGSIVGGDFRAQATRVMENLRAVLKAADTDFAHVLKTTVYLTSMDNFPVLNEVYALAFGESRPARSTVAVSALPKGVQVEIDLIAKVPPSR